MKILLIGYYDYSYYADACVLDNNEIKDMELTAEQLATINHFRDWGNRSEEYKKIKEEIFSQYDMVILCEDGSFELLKGTNEECLKMSKELEEAELPKVKKVGDGIFCFEDDQGMVFMPKAKYEESEKKFKALEIIKEHRLDIDWFLQFVKQDISYKHYVYCVEQGDNKFAQRFLLNEEEYNLLKEMLK